MGWERKEGVEDGGVEKGGEGVENGGGGDERGNKSPTFFAGATARNDGST